jgi:hypothetical protein
MADHRANYKSWKDGKYHYVSSFSLFEEGNGNIEIVLIEKFACESKEELHSRERHWIETMDCVNKHIPTRTRKEYYDQNKEQISEYNKQYREQNKEQLSEKKKQKIQCECGIEISRQNLLKHKKTKKHTEAMKHCSTP